MLKPVQPDSLILCTIPISSFLYLFSHNTLKADDSGPLITVLPAKTTTATTKTREIVRNVFTNNPLNIKKYIFFTYMIIIISLYKLIIKNKEVTL